MIAREYDEEQTYYLYDRGQRVVEVIENSGEMLDVTERNLWNPNAVDQVLATERINFDDPTPTVQTIWGITDKSGTVRDTIQPDYSAADKIVAIRYDEFGKPKEYDGYEDRFTPLYAGRDYDTVTGLYINRARWYDPESQRFISEDSWGYAAGDTNLYRYAGNSPTNATDPSGHFALGGLYLSKGFSKHNQEPDLTVFQNKPGTILKTKNGRPLTKNREA